MSTRLEIISSIIFCLLCANYVFGVQSNRKVNVTGPRTSPWTPIPSKNRYGYHIPLAASESRSFSTNSNENNGNSNNNNNNYNGSPMIKHRESGATVGLDIPDSNLRLLLDIDELAAKPSADAIKLKVIEREQHDRLKSDSRRSPSTYARQQSSPQHHSSMGNNNNNKPSYTANLPSSSNGKQYKIGFIRASDIHTAINSGVIPPGSQPLPVPSSAYVNGPSSNIVVSASTGGPTIQTSSQYHVKYSQPIPGDSPINNAIHEVKNVEVHKYPSNFVESPSNAPQIQAAASLTAPSASASKTNTRQIVQQEQQKSLSNGKTNPDRKGSKSNNSKTNSQRKIATTTTTTTSAPVKTENVVQQQQQRQEERKIPESPKSQKKVSKTFEQQQQKFTPEDGQQRQAAADVSDEQDEVDVLKSDDQGLDQSGEDDGFGDNVQIKDTSSETSSRLRAGRNSLDSDDSLDDDDDFDLLKITPRSSSFAGQENCNAISSTFSGDSDSMTIKEFAARLGADAIFSMFPGMEDQMQNVVDFANAGYTIFLPSNDAVSRLPRTLINRLKSKPEELKKLIENHVSDEKQSLKSMKSNLVMSPRATNSRLRVNKLGSSLITVNGQRVTQMDQRGPMGGSVNVLDGVLYPAADKNVMETLKSCNRFDGFVTLAEGTGLGDTLSKGLWFEIIISYFGSFI